MKDLKQSIKDKIVAVGLDEASKLFETPKSIVSKWADGSATPTLKAAQIIVNEMPAPDLGFASLFSPSSSVVTWEGQKVMILFPSYKYINPLTNFTLFANYARYGADKLGLATKNLTVIHEARSFLIHVGMLNKSIEDFIFIDDDMVLPCGNEQIFNGNFRMRVKPTSAQFNFISRIMSHPRDLGVIGALYYGRHEFGMPQCDWGFNPNRGTNANELRAEKHTGLKEMDWVATGGLRIPRWVIEKKRAEIDAGRWPELKPATENGYYGYFHPMRAGFGEDMSFGYRLKEIGIKSFLDSELVLGHAEGNVIWGPKNTRNPTANDH